MPGALTTAAVLAAMSLSMAAWITPALAGVVLLYGLIQVGYCLQLKRMPLLDLFCIYSGFLLWAIAGAVAAMHCWPAGLAGAGILFGNLRHLS